MHVYKELSFLGDKPALDKMSAEIYKVFPSNWLKPDKNDFLKDYIRADYVGTNNTLMQWCVDNDFCAEAARAVRYDSDFIWQTESWPTGEYILSEKDRSATKLEEILSGK